MTFVKRYLHIRSVGTWDILYCAFEEKIWRMFWGFISRLGSWIEDCRRVVTFHLYTLKYSKTAGHAGMALLEDSLLLPLCGMLYGSILKVFIFYFHKKRVKMAEATLKAPLVIFIIFGYIFPKSIKIRLISKK